MSAAAINAPEDLSQELDLLAEMFGTEAISSVVQPETSEADKSPSFESTPAHAEISTSPEAEPVQEASEISQPDKETLEGENAPQDQPEAVEAESKADIPDRVANLVETMAAEFGPPKKAENVEEALDIPLPPGGWQEIFTDWNTW